MNAPPNIALDTEAARTRRLALFNQILAPSTRILLHQAGLKAGHHAVDLGCGIGDVALQMSEVVGTTGRVYAIDRDPHAVAQVRQRADARGDTRIASICNDIGAVLPAIRPADLVYARFVLMHAPDPQRVLDAIRRTLKPGGCIVLEEPILEDADTTSSDPLWREANDIYARWARFENIRPDIGRILPAMVQRAGFTIHTSRRQQPMIEPAVAQNYVLSALACARARYIAAGVVTQHAFDVLYDFVSAFDSTRLATSRFHTIAQLIAY